LRHRYLEPLHPDDFVEGGRYTESLLALTGISSTDAFFDERNRAIRAVADRLRQQLIDDQASGELQRLAIQEALQPLAKQSETMRLLAIAATFGDIFPRSLLLEMTVYERLHSPEVLLNNLIAQRYLLTGDEGQSLWLSPVLRRHVYEIQPKEESRQRHRWIASYYEEDGDALRAACHWQSANEDGRAMRVLMPAAPALIDELQVQELIETLQQMEAKRLESDQWYEVQLLLSDLYRRTGQFEETLAACRHALKATQDSFKQARVYRRMGKLYESRNQSHALRYYQQAVERFAPAEPELAELLKDRGWLYVLRREWEKAEADLQQALKSAPKDAKRLQADILDAMASLNRERGQRECALTYAERALALREEVGDLLSVAKSLGNLGFLYRLMGDYDNAILAHQEALATYQKLGNKELMAAAWLNVGAAHYHNDKLSAAIEAYRQSLAIGQIMGLPLIELKAHYNLAEALAATGQEKQAARHWGAGYQLCQEHNFDDQAADFLELGKTLNIATGVSALSANGHAPIVGSDGHTLSVTPFALFLSADEEFVLALVRREQTITTRRLMEAASISRATATRRLTGLVEKGWLTAYGQGRGAYYLLADHTTNADGDLSTPAETSVTDTMAEKIHLELRKVQPALAAHYAVSSVGLAPSEPTSRYAKIVVRFTQPPDLERYFTLKQHLSDTLQVEVDLVPDFSPSPMPAQSAIDWLWEE
jgi:tetratricopeptide (TPR) repeat protein